jgi:hypothetical protein
MVSIFPTVVGSFDFGSYKDNFHLSPARQDCSESEVVARSLLLKSVTK